MSRRIRALVAKPGLDGHERGAFVLVHTLRDSGMEVIYTGLRQTPYMIVEAAIQEAVDVIGVSILSGAHIELIGRLMKLLKEKEVDIPVLVGGIIPRKDRDALMNKGVKGIYGPGTTTEQIVNAVKSVCQD
jgi:methylmalonyl-CoA mutase C-terminal domain/subunit